MAFFLSGFFSHLYTSTILFFTLLLLDLAIPIQSAIEILCTVTSTAQRRRQLSSGQFLDLVEENVPRTLYTKGLCPYDSLESCSVCLSNFEEGDEMRKLNCEHKFHKECLDTWLKQGNQGAAATCPLCRRMVLPEDIFCSHDHDENNDGSDEDFLVYYLLSANRMM